MQASASSPSTCFCFDMPKRRRVDLFANQKALIIEECERRDAEGVNWTLAEIAEWAKKRLSMNDAPHIATVSRLLRAKRKIVDSVFDGKGERKRDRTLRCEAIEYALVEWIWDQYARNVFVSDDLIKEKDRRLLTAVNAQLPADAQISLQLSNG